MDKIRASQRVRATMTFVDETGNAFDPPTVTLKYSNGTTTTTWTYGTGTHITRLSTGKYQAVVYTTTAPDSTWTFELLAPAVAADVDTVQVQAPPL